MRQGAVRDLNSLGDQGLNESWGAKMLDEYGEGDQGTVGTVLVSHSVCCFAVLFVCWLVCVHVQDLCKQKQFEVLYRHSESPVLLDDMESEVQISPSRCSGRRLQRRSQEMVVGPGGRLPKRSHRMSASDEYEWRVVVDVLYFLTLYFFLGECVSLGFPTLVI